MNRTFGLASSMGVAAVTVLFAASMLAPGDQSYVSYALSLILSWTYILLACSFAAEAPAFRKAAAHAGLVFAALYAAFVGIVYFVQLTTVLHNSAPADIIGVLSYRQLGSLMFNLDLLGYAMMALSTLFIGLSIISKSVIDRVLKALLIIHGVFAPACLIMPISNVFGTMKGASGDAIGIAVLLGWCVYFTPIGILSYLHFRGATYWGRRATARQQPNSN
jgi:hypothetical protein